MDFVDIEYLENYFQMSNESDSLNENEVIEEIHTGDNFETKEDEKLDETGEITTEIIEFQISDETSIYADDSEIIEYHLPEETSETRNDQETEPAINDSNKTQESSGKDSVKVSRKRKRNEQNWKSNIRKKLRQKGESYISSRKKTVPAKKIRNLKNCEAKCLFNCKFISENDQQTICRDFYNLDSDGKRHYLLRSTERLVPARRRCDKTNESSAKKYSYRYFFEVQGNRIRVCKNFFLGTLAISQKPVYNVHKDKNPLSGIPVSSKQGKHLKKVISEELKNEVREHILSFPTVESHYTRRDTKKKYLESNLSISEMYNLYKQDLKNQNRTEYVKKSMYAFIFNSNFNLSFHVPKKDRCDLCEEIKTLENNHDIISEPIALKYTIHQEEKKAARESRRKDRESNVPVLSFDLENVLSCPRAEISSFFYNSKLNVYNLTAHLSTNNNVYCCIWNETQMGRSGNDIASALIKILKSVVLENPELNEIILWSDSCVPQNGNSLMSFAIIDFLKVNPTIQNLTMKYSSPGHSCIQEIDAVHSVIERKLRKREFYSPISLLRILLKIKYKNKYLKVLQMKSQDFKNYNVCAGKLNFKLIPYSKVTELNFSQSLTMLKYKISHNEDNWNIEDIKQNKLNTRKKYEDDFQFPVPKEVPPKVELSAQKAKSFTAMLKFMPQIDRQFFETILMRDNIDYINTTMAVKMNE